jgi:hypothetical protein
MNDKSRTSAFLGGFAVATIIFSFLIGRTINKIDQDYIRKTEVMKKTHQQQLESIKSKLK